MDGGDFATGDYDGDAYGYDGYDDDDGDTYGDNDVEPLGEGEQAQVVIDDGRGDQGGAPAEAASDEEELARSVQAFCVRWVRIHLQVAPTEAELHVLAVERKALKTRLTEYMQSAALDRALVTRAGAEPLVIRVDPVRPSTSMKPDTINAAVYQCASVQLAEMCAQMLQERAQKRLDKEAAARATAERKAARAAKPRPAKRGRDQSPKASATEAVPEPAVPTQSVQEAAAHGAPAQNESATPSIAQVLGEMLLVATRKAQQIMVQGRVRLSVVPREKDMSFLSCTDTPSGTEAATAGNAESKATKPVKKRRRTEAAESNADLSDSKNAGTRTSDEKSGTMAATDPKDDDGMRWGDAPDVIAQCAICYVDLEKAAAQLRAMAAPLNAQLRALTADLPPEPTPRASARTRPGAPPKAPTARQQEAAAKRARHEALAPLRTNVARYLQESKMDDKKGMPIEFPTVPGMFRLRTKMHPKPAPLSDVHYRPLATEAASAALTQISVDPSTVCSPETLGAVLTDDEFRNLLSEALAQHVARYREANVVYTRSVKLAKVPQGRPRAAPQCHAGQQTHP